MQSQEISGLLPTQDGVRAVAVRFSETIESVREISTSDELPMLTSGLVDTHIHGLMGTEVSDNPESLRDIASQGAKFGVTRTILSLVSSNQDHMLRVLGAAERVLGESGFAGLHLEGPFLAESRCGAHQVSNLRDVTDEELSQIVTSPAFSSITVAPERLSIEQVRVFANSGIVAVGHTDADYELSAKYFSSGASVLTHALNAMPQLSSRSPGPLGAALQADALVEIIADGEHLHPAVVSALFAMSNKPTLVTDSISAAGLGDTELLLGEVAVRVESGVARRIDNGALAGSTLTLNKAVSNCVGWGVSAFDAVRAASSTPAQHYKLGRQIVEQGAVADLVLWNDFEPLAVFRAGKLVHGSLIS